MATAVDTVARVYARWSAGELPGLADEVDPAVELVQDPLCPDAALHGRDGWQAWAARWDDRFEGLRVDADALIPVDESNVLALVSMTAAPAGGGTPMSWAAAHVWTVRGGRVTRWQAHLDLDAARATLDA